MALGVKFIQKGEASVFDAVKALSTLSKQAIVRPNNPPPGIAGYVMDVVGEESIDLDSDITDNWVENNTAIQDHIALKPEQITVNGVVAELVNVAVKQDPRAPTANPLPPVVDLVPALTPQAQANVVVGESATVRESESVTSGNSLFGYYSNRTPSPNITRQTKAFSFFYQMWKGRQLCSVETPWGVWNNMALMRLRASQKEDTRSQSEFTATFKKIRFAQDLTVSIGQIAGRAGGQRQDTTQNGLLGKEEVSTERKQSWIVQLTT